MASAVRKKCSKFFRRVFGPQTAASVGIPASSGSTGGEPGEPGSSGGSGNVGGGGGRGGSGCGGGGPCSCQDCQAAVVTSLHSSGGGGRGVGGGRSSGGPCNCQDRQAAVVTSQKPRPQSNLYYCPIARSSRLTVMVCCCDTHQQHQHQHHRRQHQHQPPQQQSQQPQSHAASPFAVTFSPQQNATSHPAPEQTQESTPIPPPSPQAHRTLQQLQQLQQLQRRRNLQNLLQQRAASCIEYDGALPRLRQHRHRESVPTSSTSTSAAIYLSPPEQAEPMGMTKKVIQRRRTYLRELATDRRAATDQTVGLAKAFTHRVAPPLKTLWLPLETASPLPPVAAPAVATVAVHVHVGKGSGNGGPVLIIKKPPPPQLAKLRGPPVVTKALSRPLTPSPDRSGERMETGTVTPPAFQVIGRVAEAVRRLDARQRGSSHRFRLSPRRAGVLAAVAVACPPAAPSALAAAAVVNPPGKQRPQPSFQELLAKFEAFDRRRHQRTAAAAAVAAEAAAAVLTPLGPRPQPTFEAPEGVVAALPAASANLIGDDFTDDDEETDDDQLMDSSETPREATVNGGAATRTLRVVALTLLCLCLGSGILQLALMAFGAELTAEMLRWRR